MRGGATHEYEWCEDIDQQDFTCPPDDCLSLYSDGERSDGVYTVQMEMTLADVWCDMNTEGGGWTVIQSRVDGSTDFDKTWQEYEQGFGNPNGNYWMGLERIHAMTRGPTELYIYLEKLTQSAYARYASFSVGDASTNYRLTVSDCHGTAADSLIEHHNGMAFSTWDRDNDLDPEDNCSAEHGGGWWFNACGTSNLNGHHRSSYAGLTQNDYDALIQWENFISDYHPLKLAKMMIRPLK